MKQVRKVLSILLVCCMVFTLVPTITFATDIESDGEISSESGDVIEEQTTEESDVVVDIPSGETENSNVQEQNSESKKDGVNKTETEDIETESDVKEDEISAYANVRAASAVEAETTINSIQKSRSVSLDTSSLYKIYHLDCGRKYFSVAQIEEIIDILAANDFNTLELAVGNDGMRFLLDDMSVTVNDTTYSSDAVKAGIQAGNKAYYDAGTNELTQTEMDTIIAYANSKNIAIIPLINSPGHMDAILTAATSVTGTDCSYDRSSRTIDVTNATAVNFTLAFVEKYIEYFAGKGCTIFNMGCDEYANDIYSSGSMGFGNLVSSEKYSYFIDYVNNMAAQVQNAGMVPMAFNDGFYFNENTSSGTFDTNIAVSFWSSGWSGYTSMSAANLAAKGHKIINTNGDWYYILKTSDIDTVNTNISNAPYNSVMGSGTMDVAGCMLCFWCDTPSENYDDTEVANLTSQINTFASVNSSVFDLSKTEDVTVTDEDTSISVTAPELTKLSVTSTEAPTIEGAKNVVAYNITPSVEGSDYTGEAVVAIPVPDGWDVNRVHAFVVNEDGTIERIMDVSIENRIATFTVPHFSDMGLYEAEETEVTKEETITVVAGGTYEKTISDVNYEGTYTTADPSTATVTVTGKDAVEATTNYKKASVTCNTLIGSDSDSWTAVSGYYYTPDGTNYYPVYAKRSEFWGIYKYTWGYSTSDSSSKVNKIRTQSTDDTSDSPNIAVYTKSETTGTSASTTIIFTAAADAAGKSTTVTIGDTLYTINVIQEDITTVKGLSIEYWITNGRPTDTSDNNSMTVRAVDAYVEEGIDVTNKVPVNTTKETRTLQYWRCRLLDKSLGNSSTSGTEEQTEGAGDDETYSGTEFTKVRYWNSKWSVYTIDGTWEEVEDNHQLVAYYLEILPISDELEVTAADWGKKGDGTTSGDYLDPSSSCTVSVQVVYEDGTTNPASTTATDLKSCTIAYGYWEGGRGVGTLNLSGMEGYQIWKVEAETGAVKYDYYNSSMWGAYTVDSFTWDDNAKTVYEGDPVDSYIIHNDAHNPSSEGYYGNLMWDENHEAILLKVYVKAKPSDDNLKVIYYDEKFGEELYSYGINVKNGVTFDDITPTPSEFSGNDSRIDVTGCGIENTLGVTQQFQTDLTKVPEAVGKYNSGLYKYTGSVISEDRKTLYLYYNLDTSVLSPMFVIDYGRPFTFELGDVVSEIGTVQSVSVKQDTKYGTLTYENGVFTYTPTKILLGIDVLTINITFDGNTSPTTTNAGVMPASTVDYEEGFADLTGFTGKSRGTVSQTSQLAGKSTDEYGYDAYVATETNTCASSSAKGNTATFTFSGTGVDLYVNSKENSGNIAVQVRDSSNRLVKVVSVKTTSYSTITGNFSNTEQNGLIAVAVQGLDYGQYTVKITSTSDSIVYFDGFRVYGTLQDQSNDYYTKDNEDNPTFLELRDYVLTSMDVDNNQSSAAVYAQVRETTDKQLTSVLLSNSDNSAIATTGQKLLENGPKNELFLLPGQMVVFKVNTNREVQVGMKAVNGSVEVTGNYSGIISTDKDMFYKVVQKSEIASEQTINIINASSASILSITKVKICDDPSATFAELNEDDFDDALKLMGITEPEVPTIPEVTYADATLNIALNDADGIELATKSLTANGVTGETAAFAAADIEAAAAGLVPDGYELTDVTYSDVEVAYGETETITFTASEKTTDPGTEPGGDDGTEETPEQPTNIWNQILTGIKNFFNGLFGWKK